MVSGYCYMRVLLVLRAGKQTGSKARLSRVLSLLWLSWFVLNLPLAGFEIAMQTVLRIDKSDARGASRTDLVHWTAKRVDTIINNSLFSVSWITSDCSLSIQSFADTEVSVSGKRYQILLPLHPSSLHPSFAVLSEAVLRVSQFHSSHYTNSTLTTDILENDGLVLQNKKDYQTGLERQSCPKPELSLFEQLSLFVNISFFVVFPVNKS